MDKTRDRSHRSRARESDEVSAIMASRIYAFYSKLTTYRVQLMGIGTERLYIACEVHATAPSFILHKTVAFRRSDVQPNGARYLVVGGGVERGSHHRQKSERKRPARTTPPKYGIHDTRRSTRHTWLPVKTTFPRHREARYDTRVDSTGKEFM